MAIGREDQNEDEDLDVVVVEDQNVQDQNQAMEQDLDDQYRGGCPFCVGASPQ